MIVVVGLSHRTAPIEVRERAALPEEEVGGFLQAILASPSIGEAVVVSTCNRVEIIAASAEDQSEVSALDVVSRAFTARVPGVEPHLYRLAGDEALRHLFSVAASLDSMVMGEPQILGQVKDAYEAARRAGAVGPRLSRALDHAIRTAKRVRSETAIGAGQVSVPSVAVDLARQIFGAIEGHSVVLVGSGEMGETAAKLLKQAGAELSVLGRNRERTEALCGALGAKPRALEDLAQALWEADVVITATRAPSFVITRDAVRHVHKKRRGRSLFLIDLAVPRDVDPGVDELDSVYLYNVDDLSEIVQASLSTRQREAERAADIVKEELGSFGRSRHAEQVTPTLLALRTRFQDVLVAELERTLERRLKHLNQEDREALVKMLDAAVNKLLHPSTRLLRQLASDEDSRAELGAQLAMLEELFELERVDAAGSPEPREGAARATVAALPKVG